MKQLSRLLIPASLLVCLIAGGAQPAAASMINPDITLFDLTIVDSPFSATGSPSCVPVSSCTNMSWTSPSGGAGGSTNGTTSITWNGLTGAISVFDNVNNIQLLLGSITSFASNGLGDYTLMALLTQSNIPGMGLYVDIQLSDFTQTADIFPSVPEPGTIGLLGMGFAALAARRRRRAQF